MTPLEARFESVADPTRAPPAWDGAVNADGYYVRTTPGQ